MGSHPSGAEGNDEGGVEARLDRKTFVADILSQLDAGHSNKVSMKQFHDAIEELNRHFQKQGRPPLSETQVNAICEIASGGSQEVAYTSFLNSLHIADTGMR